jgi:nitrogen fixation protein NifU and related proteins
MNKFYSKKVLQHFRHPKNQGQIKNADATGEVGNVVCGDVMKVYLKIDPKTQIIEDIKFETYGCAAAIATSSALTVIAKGKTIDEAKKITKNDIVEFLEYLPPIKLHCSLLSVDALAKALENYTK